MRIATIAVTTLSFVPALALADGDYRIGGEIGLYHDGEGSGSVTALTEVIDADLMLARSIALVGGVPFAQLISTGEDRFRIGNPYAAIYYQQKGDVLRLRIGGGFAIPAAQVPDDEISLFAPPTEFTYQLGWFMHGLQGPWLWTPETLPVIVPSLRLGADFGVIEILAEADVVMLIALREEADDVELVIPTSVGAIAHLSIIGLGARVGATFMPTNEGADKAQLSISPLIMAELGPVELEARLTVNVDGPAGFSFDDGGVWGFFLGAHAVF